MQSPIGLELICEESAMACPYFIPAEVHEREFWPHRERLPLGDGFAGRCAARAPSVRCDDETLRLHCNLGYAGLGCAPLGSARLDATGRDAGDDGAGRGMGRDPGCVHLPAGGAFDAIRFLVQRESAVMLRVQFACERAHLPALCGALRYDQSLKTWLERPDVRLLDLAEAAVRAWIARNASG
jgi:hypothetical protein